MRRATVLAAALTLPGAALAAEPCAIAGLTRQFAAVSEMPQPVKNFFFYKFREPPAGIAARNEPFNATDVIMPGEKKPMRRLIDAGMRDSRWFVWYEHGGLALHEHLMLFELAPSDTNIRIVANVTAGGNNDFCARARDFIAGGGTANMRIEGEW